MGFRFKKWLSLMDQKTECSSLIAANLHINDFWDCKSGFCNCHVKESDLEQGATTQYFP